MAVYEKTAGTALNKTTKIYDVTGRLVSVKDGDVNALASSTITYDYYTNGNKKFVLYPNGAKQTYTYHENNLLWTLKNYKTATDIQDTYTYEYDEANNQVKKIDSKGTTNYDYDYLNRLEIVTENPDVSSKKRITQYTYDKAGNRESETVTDAAKTYIKYEYAPQANLLKTVTKSVNDVVQETITYSYYDNGNQWKTVKTPYVNGVAQTAKAQELSTNEYDKLNQLIKSTIGTTVVTNSYNGDGQRVTKDIKVGSNPSTLTRYLYEYDQVVQELNSSGNSIARNIYGTNLAKRTVGTQSYYYLYNGHADTTALINASTGTVDASYYYDAFGNVTYYNASGQKIDPSAALNNNVLYAGYQYDKEAGTYYLNSRMYDPVTARFLQEDTYQGDASDPLSLNLYTYCHNEPIMYIDPTGHSEKFLDMVTERVSENFDSLFKSAIDFTFETVKDVESTERKIKYVVENPGEVIKSAASAQVEYVKETAIEAGSAIKNGDFDEFKRVAAKVTGDLVTEKIMDFAMMPKGSKTARKVMRYEDDVIDFTSVTRRATNDISTVETGVRLSPDIEVERTVESVAHRIDDVNDLNSKVKRSIDMTPEEKMHIDSLDDVMRQEPRGHLRSVDGDIGIDNTESKIIEALADRPMQMSQRFTEADAIFELQKSPVGNQTLEFIENNNLKVGLSYETVEKGFMGHYIPKDGVVKVYIKSHYKYGKQEVAKTIIHEVTHNMGVGGSKRAEMYCRIRELKHIYQNQKIPLDVLKKEYNMVYKSSAYMGKPLGNISDIYNITKHWKK